MKRLVAINAELNLSSPATFDVDDITQDVFIYADEFYLAQAIDQLIRNSIEHKQRANVRLTLEFTDKTKNIIRFALTDDSIKLEQREIDMLFKSLNIYETISNITYKINPRLILAKIALEINNGIIYAEEVEEIGTKFVFEISNLYKKKKDDKVKLVWSKYINHLHQDHSIVMLL